MLAPWTMPHPSLRLRCTKRTIAINQPTTICSEMGSQEIYYSKTPPSFDRHHRFLSLSIIANAKWTNIP